MYNLKYNWADSKKLYFLGGAYFWLKLADFQKMQNRHVSNFVQKGSILGCKLPGKLCKSEFWLKITEYCSLV